MATAVRTGHASLLRIAAERGKTKGEEEYLLQTQGSLALCRLLCPCRAPERRARARRGKRTGGYGSFLLAVYSADDEELQTISKIGTGFSEEQLVQLSEQLRALVIPGPKPYYRRARAPRP